MTHSQVSVLSRMSLSQSSRCNFILHPVTKIFIIPHPASILSLIPHPPNGKKDCNLRIWLHRVLKQTRWRRRQESPKFTYSKTVILHSLHEQFSCSTFRMHLSATSNYQCFSYNPQTTGTYSVASALTRDYREMIAGTRSYIFRWRSSFRRRVLSRAPANVLPVSKARKFEHGRGRFRGELRIQFQDYTDC